MKNRAKEILQEAYEYYTSEGFELKESDSGYYKFKDGKYLLYISIHGSLFFSIESIFSYDYEKTRDLSLFLMQFNECVYFAKAFNNADEDQLTIRIDIPIFLMTESKLKGDKSIFSFILKIIRQCNDIVVDKAASYYFDEFLKTIEDEY